MDKGKERKEGEKGEEPAYTIIDREFPSAEEITQWIIDKIAQNKAEGIKAHSPKKSK
jgi:hypothetical protein